MNVMKRYRLFILLVVVLSSFLGSCDEQDVIRYENDPRIYFYKGMCMITWPELLTRSRIV